MLALKNAVRDGRVAHAYLFSGPRGTGKTSTARILAKALNCANPLEGEPCGVCDSCRDIARGASLDVHELDAASNNRVDDMRDLVSRASLASPGEWKVYIVDEVHMLSTAASNALLKTLEEPPGRVVFVLATTDPQKVLPTIRSRTQHYEFHLFETEVLTSLLEEIAVDARLELPGDGIQAAVRRGHGSARDAISALDQVAAAGVVDDGDRYVRDIVGSIAERETEAALRSVAAALVAGFDAPRLASDLVDSLRTVFLTTVAPGTEAVVSTGVPAGLPSIGPARCVRALEILGAAMVDMRESLDARTTLEVALVKLTHPEVDDSAAAVLERLERLERKMSDLAERLTAPGAPPAPPAPLASRAPETRRAMPGPASGEGADASSTAPGERPALGAFRAGGPGSGPGPATGPPVSPVTPAGGRAGARPDSAGPATDAVQPAGAGGAGGRVPSRDDLVTAWADHVLARLRPRARAIYASGRFVTVEDDEVTIALPNAAHVEHASPLEDEVARTLGEHFGCRLRVRLVADPDTDPGGGPEQRSAAKSSGGGRTTGATLRGRTAGAVARDEGDEGDDLEEVSPEDIAGDVQPHDSVSWVENRLLEEFPGAEEVS